MRRIFICTLFAFTLAARCEAEDVAVKTVEAIQKSVVPILCMTPDEAVSGGAKVKKILGTGFFINRTGYFLTAAHVVLGLTPTCGENAFWAVYVPTASWNTRQKLDKRWFRFTECRYNEVTDVAACKLSNNPFDDDTVNKIVAPVRFGTFVNHPDGSAVAFTGFPLESTVPITSKGYIATYFAIEDLFGIDKSGWGGASGSPVYDSKGLVIGLVLKRTTSDSSGLTFARPVDHILGFLRNEKIEIEK